MIVMRMKNLLSSSGLSHLNLWVKQGHLQYSLHQAPGLIQPYISGSYYYVSGISDVSLISLTINIQNEKIQEILFVH